MPTPPLVSSLLAVREVPLLPVPHARGVVGGRVVQRTKTTTTTPQKKNQTRRARAFLVSSPCHHHRSRSSSSSSSSSFIAFALKNSFVTTTTTYPVFSCWPTAMTSSEVPLGPAALTSASSRPENVSSGPLEARDRIHVGRRFVLPSDRWLPVSCRGSMLRRRQVQVKERDKLC